MIEHAAARPVVIASGMRAEGDTGVQTHQSTFARHLGSVGRTVNFATPFDAPAWLSWPAVGVRRLLEPVAPQAAVRWYRAGHFALVRIALRRALSALDGAAIYAQCPVSAAAALRERRAGDRVVMAVHFNVSQAEEWANKGRIARQGAVYRGIREFEKDVLPRLDGLVFVSRFLQEAVLRDVPAAATVPATIQPNFVDPGQPADAAPARDLITIGTLEPRKNHAYLLDVVAAARRLGRIVTLTVVGDGPLRQTLAQRAAALGIAGQVEFAGRVLGARRLIASHRLYAHAATLESFGITLIEAMAAGRPVVAARTGGIPEVFDDGVEGIGWPLDDADEAARRLLALLADDDRLARLASAARSRFAREYATPVVAARLARFVDGAADATSVRGDPPAADVQRPAPISTP